MNALRESLGSMMILGNHVSGSHLRTRLLRCCLKVKPHPEPGFLCNSWYFTANLLRSNGALKKQIEAPWLIAHFNMVRTNSWELSTSIRLGQPSIVSACFSRTNLRITSTDCSSVPYA